MSRIALRLFLRTFWAKPGDGRSWRDLLPVRMELARELLAALGVLPPQ